MASRELIRVEGLGKSFPFRAGPLAVRVMGWVRAVDDVSFSIAEGETFALVGETGSGKTTTGRLILRLDAPTEGGVTRFGRDVHRLRGDELKSYRMSVQAVFQDPWASLNPRMRVSAIVSESLVVNQRLKRRVVRARVEEALEQVGMQPWHANLFPHEFSGGERQRVALAAALVTGPKLVVLDEPVSALDISVRAQVLNLLKEIQRQRGTAYLLISHDLATVRHLAHTVAVMYMGQIVEQAEAEDLFRFPQHPYTQSLIASILPPHPDAGRQAEVPEGEVPSPLDPPSGCRFRTRCPLAMDICSTTPPEPREARTGHMVRCHLY